LSIVDIYKTKEMHAEFVGQMPNVYPIFWIMDNIYKYNPFPLLFGSGFGSASHVINLLGGWNGGGSNNPHANIIRVISEAGLIGLYVYILAFYKPVSKLSKKILSDHHSNLLIIYLLFMLSISFGHRSSSIFIFAGITYSYLNLVWNQKTLKNTT
jgi:O-antigen ligase